MGEMQIREFKNVKIAQININNNKGFVFIKQIIFNKL